MPSGTTSDNIVKHTSEKRKARVIIIAIDICSSLVLQSQYKVIAGRLGTVLRGVVA